MQEREQQRKLEEEQKISEHRARSDTLLIACFEEGRMKRNVAALSTAGRERLFGRVLGNVLETETDTRMITVEPITPFAA